LRAIIARDIDQFRAGVARGILGHESIDEVKYWWVLKLGAFIIVLYLGELSNVTCLVQPAHTPIDKNQLHGSGTIMFVPLTQSSESTLKALADYYQKTYGLIIEVAPVLRLPDSTYDSGRKQFVAEEIIANVRRQVGLDTKGRTLVPIALTDQDIYIRGYNWRYAFSYRENGVGLVSSARMDHWFMGVWRPDEEIQAARLRKMVTKNIGVLYYRLPLSSHCRSVMYGKVGGPQELDFMGEEF
jgi:predicted Zn-dependent protease